MLGVLSSNLFILIVTTTIVVTLVRRRSFSKETDHHLRPAGGTGESAAAPREIIVGFAGAAVILAALIVVRRVGVVDSPAGATRIGWLGIVAGAEELVKYAMTGRLRPLRRRDASERTDPAGPVTRRSTTGAPLPFRFFRIPSGTIQARALLRGCGFALAENLLYLLLVPGRFLLRLILAGLIHLGTVTFYAWPQSAYRSRVTVGVVRLAVGVLIHLGYNIAIVSTATRLVLW